MFGFVNTQYGETLSYESFDPDRKAPNQRGGQKIMGPGADPYAVESYPSFGFGVGVQVEGIPCQMMNSEEKRQIVRCVGTSIRDFYQHSTSRCKYVFLFCLTQYCRAVDLKPLQSSSCK